MQNDALNFDFKDEVRNLRDRVGALEKNVQGLLDWSSGINKHRTSVEKSLSEIKDSLQVILERLPSAESKA